MSSILRATSLVVVMFFLWDSSVPVWGEVEGNAEESAVVDGAFLADSTAPALNRKMLQYCQKQIGRKVGDGECATLVTEAYRIIHAKRLPPYGSDADYVWGAYVGTFRPNSYPTKKILPGDVLQFRNARFNGRTARGTYTSTASHHTAVVSQIRGRTIYALQQNVGRSNVSSVQKRKVQGGKFVFSDLKAGWVKVYRPIPAKLAVGNGEVFIPNPSLASTYGSVRLKHGFLPDPYKKVVVAGGRHVAKSFGIKMHIANAPDFSVYYTARNSRLTIYAKSNVHTTLLINDPKGKWSACGKGGIRYARPLSGRYDIWVGTANPGNAQATLYISEK